MKKILIFLLFLLSAAFARAEDLIHVSHDKVRPGQEFKVRIKGDLPYKIQPEPKFVWSIKEDSGDRVVAVTAGDEPLTIIVEYSLIQMTFEEALAAPSFEDRDQMILWFKKHEKPFHDSATVMIEGGPGPKPPDDPDDDDPQPEPDNLTAKVKEWLSKVESPQKPEEQKRLAELYLTLSSQAGAGLNDDQLVDAMTRGHVEALGANSRRWFGFIKSLGHTLNATAGTKEKGKVFESVGNALKAL